MKLTRNIVAMMTAVVFLATVFGCAATHTKIAKKELDVQTKMSDSIFLEPVGPKKRVVFV